mmetsp:Transcript_7457/g.15490  ORF Transcript_7457/g.15490 Transcript_7457/m.15490 type:complete len:789 (+) Transcript_7457:189-2555(+)
MDDSDDDIPLASLNTKHIVPPSPPKVKKETNASPTKASNGSIPKKVKSAPPPPPDDGLTADERAYKEKLKAIKKFAKLEKKAKKEKKRQKQEKEKKRKLSPASGGGAKKPRGPAKARAPPGPKVAKALDKTARFASAMKAFLWWDAPVLPPGQQWRTMEHGGVAFPEPYEPHGVGVMYGGEEVRLTPEQEEAVTFMAGMDPNGMHLGNEKTRKIFVDNFFKDFKKLLPKGSKIKEFGKLNYSKITEHLNTQKMVKKAITDAERARNKGLKDSLNFKHGYAIVDGHLEKVGNYNMEPPGTFRGRGEHPKMGRIKQRVVPEQVYMNFSADAPPPICPVRGRAWGEVRHDPCVQWLGNWKENINGQDKYMQLAAMSSFKGKSDRSKYNKAARLCGNIGKIRKDYKKNLTAKDRGLRQLATAMWVIDRLALRVGGEKDTDEEADTVGCCSLRVEHVTFNPNDEEGSFEIELEFLGKDSMLFKQTVDLGSELYNDDNGMGTQVYKNFKAFCQAKKPSDDIFETLTPTILNQHLGGLMPGLSAKVFRTYNASVTLQSELQKKEAAPGWSSLTVAQKVTEYNAANRTVAILCNHQRTVSKAQEAGLQALEEKVNTLVEQKKVLKKMLKIIQAGGAAADSLPLKKSEAEMKESVASMLEKAKKMKEAATTNEEKVAATEADIAAKKARKDLGSSKFSQAHLWESKPTAAQVAGRISLWTTKIATAQQNLKNKDDNKEVSLGTSKINYMDPRATVAFCKRAEVPIDRVFSRTLRDKFNWAMSVPGEWMFDAEVGKEP